MKNIFAKTAAATLAAALLTACGGQSASSAAPTSVAQSTAQSSAAQAAAGAAENESDDDIQPKTWISTATDIQFNIDFREYPQTSSGEGYVENINEIALAVGVSDSSTSMIYNADVSGISDAVQAPEILNPCFLSILKKTRWNGDNTGGEMNQTFTLNKAESAGTENEYELCRFEGTYSLDTHKDDKTHSFAVVGYTILLKQSGYPVYVLAADMSDDQANTGSLDKIAHDCIASLRETA